MANGLVAFGQRYRRQAAPVMLASLERVRETAVPLTPIKTGRMRRLLRAQPTGPLAYFVGWVAEDFREVGQFPYFLPVILGTRFHAGRDPLSPALEMERPRLARDLAAAALTAARGA